MEEKIFWAGIVLSTLIAAIVNYVILYLLKWARGSHLLWQGLLVNLGWIISVILTACLAVYVVAKFNKLGLISGLMIFSATGVLILTIFTAVILFLLKRFGQTSEKPPNILLTSILISILAFGLLVGGLFLTSSVSDYFIPPTLQDGE